MGAVAAAAQPGTTPPGGPAGHVAADSDSQRARLAPRLAGAIADAGGLLATIPLWLWWAVSGGGYSPSDWLAGLVYLAVWAVLLAIYVPARRPSGSARIALWALAALTAWTAASALWAADPGGAWLAAERTALWSAALALPLVWPASRRALLAGVAAFVAAALLAGVVGLVGAIARQGALIDGRLSDPFGYPNAIAAMLLAASLPALLLASHRLLRPLWRALALGAGGWLVAVSVLAQSRGSLVALALSLGAILLLAPSPARTFVPFAIAAVAIAAAAPFLLHVHAVAIDGDASGALAVAAVASVAVFAVLVVVGALYASRDLQRDDAAPVVSPRNARRYGAGVALALIVLGLVVVSHGHPVSWIDARVHEASHPNYSRVESSSDRFTAGADSNRLDYWRVALDTAASHPVAGDGAGSFAEDYLAHRHTQIGPLYAHSIWLGTFAELGAVGLALLAGAVVAMGLAIRRRRQEDPAAAQLILAASIPVVYLLAHSSVDWVSYFPAVAIPALVLAAAVAGSTLGDRAQHAGNRGGRARGVAAGVVVAAVLSLPLLASRLLVDHAYATGARHPGNALDAARLAGKLDPLGPVPPLAEGQIGLQDRDYSAARSGFEEAAARDGQGWYARFELGLLAADRGERAAALRLLKEAAALDPREQLIDQAARSVKAGSPMDPRAAARRVAAEG
jgi:O-antigen ligase/polysaccharide polymerase Wzy-like membrane protein